jgi:prepilin peptidase CpaA
MPDTPHWLQLITVSIVVLVGAVTDLRTRKIPNWLTLGALPVGFLMAGLLTGTSGLVSAGLGMLLALLIYFPLYLLRAMGAGDAKLMAAIAVFIGPFMWLHLFLAASLLGGIVAIVFTAAKGEFRNTLNRSMEILRQLAYFRAPYASNPTLDIRSARSLSLPHGAVICLSWIVLLVAWEQFDFRLIRL